MNELKLSPPWVTYFDELDSLFGPDPDIKLYFDEDDEEALVIKMYVDGFKKYEALSALLPQTKTFGNVTVEIKLIPANSDTSSASLIKNAFEGNPIVNSIETSTNPVYKGVTYVEFEKVVVQYFNDDIGDPHGMKSTLYQEVAKDVFSDAKLDGVYFCTSVY